MEISDTKIINALKQRRKLGLRTLDFHRCTSCKAARPRTTAFGKCVICLGPTYNIEENMTKTKFNTEVIFLFVEGNGGKAWAVVQEMSDGIFIALPNSDGNGVFESEARHLKQWCLSHGHGFAIERLEYTFAIQLNKDKGTFEEVNVQPGDGFVRESCGQKFICIEPTDDFVPANCVCFEGDDSGDKFVIGCDEVVSILSRKSS